MGNKSGGWYLGFVTVLVYFYYNLSLAFFTYLNIFIKELRSHMKDVHSIKLKNFSCGTCNEVFHDVVSLQQHMNVTNHR